jgi:hypothetical protein
VPIVSVNNIGNPAGERSARHFGGCKAQRCEAFPVVGIINPRSVNVGATVACIEGRAVKNQQAEAFDPRVEQRGPFAQQFIENEQRRRRPELPHYRRITRDQ